MFGYEGQTNDLKAISTGDGGLDELSEELNSGKIMYAFVRVNDSKTSLTKYLLINWQVWYNNFYTFSVINCNFDFFDFIYLYL